MSATTKTFLASMPLYLDEQDVVRYRNNLLLAFGLNDNQILINTCNDINSNVYREILIEKEAYARFLKSLVSPGKTLTKFDQEAIDKNIAEKLSHFNDLIFLEKNRVINWQDMLLMFAHFFHLKEIEANELLIKLLVTKEKEAKQFMVSQDLSPPDSNITTSVALLEKSDPYFEAQARYQETIKHIQIKEKETQDRINHLITVQQPLRQQIELQQNVVNNMQQQVDHSRALLNGMEQSLVSHLAERNQIEEKLNAKKSIKQQFKDKLAHMKEKHHWKRQQREAALKEYQEEIDSQLDESDRMKADLEALEAIFRDDSLEEEIRNNALAEYSELESDIFMKHLAVLYADDKLDDVQVKIRKMSHKEEELTQHITTLKLEIKQLKATLEGITTAIDKLNQDKLALSQQLNKQLQQTNIEVEKLNFLQEQNELIEQQKELLFDNLNEYTALKSLHENELFLSNQLLTLSEKRTKLMAHKQDTEQSLTKISNDISSMKNALVQKQKRLEKLQLKRAHSPNNNKIEKDIRKLESECTNMNKVLTAKRTEHQSLNNALERSNKDLMMIETSEKQSLHTLEKTQEHIKQANVRIDAQHRKANQLTAQLPCLQTPLTKLAPPIKTPSYRPSYDSKPNKADKNSASKSTKHAEERKKPHNRR